MFKKLRDKFDRQLHREKAALLAQLEKNINLLKANLQLINGARIKPEGFLLFSGLQHVEYHKSLQCNNETLPLQCYVINYYTRTEIPEGIDAGSDHYIVGLLTLARPYPHTIIYPERLAEKIKELFQKVELDFSSNKKFSRRFYTLTKDRALLSELLRDVALDELTRFKNLEMELHGNYCFFRHSRKPVTEQEMLKFAELAQALHRILA